jgi:ketosteroid isomerase-like protein
MSSDSDHDLLRRIYADFNARNIDAVLACMHPDVVWPNGMEGGVVHGREGIRAYWTRQWSMIDPRVEPRGFRPDGTGRTVVSVWQFVRDLSGNTLQDQMIEHIYTIEDGLIRTMEIHHIEQT